MKKTITVLLCTCLISVASWACSCIPNHSFCGSLTWEYGPDILIIGKKLSDIDHGMQVEILAVYKGAVQVEDTIMVWGDNGLQCRYPVGGFDIGEQLILGLHYMEEPWPDVEQEKAGDYELSICGIYFFSLANGHPYAPESFEEILDCIRAITGVETPIHNEGLELFPNPTSGEFSISLNEFWRTKTVQVELYNTLGQRVLVSHPTPADQLRIEASYLPAGVYWVRLRQAGKVEEEAVFKLVKH